MSRLARALLDEGSTALSRSEGAGAPGDAPRVTVLVPVAERPQPLVEIVEKVAPVLEKAGTTYEFLFVVDRWFRDLVPPLQRLRSEGRPVRAYEVAPGVGESGMLEGARGEVRGEVVLILPPYPRIASEGILALLDAVESGRADLATASRIADGQPWLSRMQRRTFHALLRGGTGVAFEDVASGVRAMRREVLEEVPVYGDLARFLPILAQREGFRVEEIPLPQHPEDVASRVYAPGIYARRLIDLLGLLFLVRFTRKPLRFFGLVGLGLVGLGGILLGDLFVDRLQGDPIADRPVLLLAVLLVVTGVQAIAMGLVGEIIVHLNSTTGRPEYRVREEDR